MGVSPCNCPLGRRSPAPACSPHRLLSSVHVHICAEIWVSGVFIKLCFLIFMLPCPMLPGLPTRCVIISLPRGRLSLQLWLFLCRLSPESPPNGSIASCPHHHPFPPWLLQRPPFWPLVSCLPLALPSAGRISFLKNVCWKHISGFPRLRTRSGSWMWSTEPHVLRLPGCSASSLPAAHLPLCTRLLYKQYHSRLLPLQAYSPNIQVFLSFSLNLT